MGGYHVPKMGDCDVSGSRSIQWSGSGAIGHTVNFGGRCVGVPPRNPFLVDGKCGLWRANVGPSTTIEHSVMGKECQAADRSLPQVCILIENQTDEYGNC